MRRIAMLLLSLLAGCGGDPVFMLPGGALTGETATPPADWNVLANIETIQVEFRPDDPYSHNIWALGIDDDLYIATSADGTRWTPFVAADPRVRARIDGTLYPLTAVPVTDSEERARVAAGYLTKYDLDADDNWVAGALIYRLDRPQ